MARKQQITVRGLEIIVFHLGNSDYISLTGIARYKNPNEPKDIIKNWLRSKATLEFLGLWEKLHNPEFKGVEFDPLMKEAGSNSFVMSPTKWVEKTNSKGIISKVGNTGGTYAHKDIAFEFASWVSPEFKLYLIKEFQRLKDEESNNNQLDWSLQRTLAKINYRIHTDAIKQTLIPTALVPQQKNNMYADEADILNVALFSKTAKQWRDENPENKGNIRDVATIEQLIVMSNLESINATLIHQKLTQSERLGILNEIAILQMRSLLVNSSVKKLT